MDIAMPNSSTSSVVLSDHIAVAVKENLVESSPRANKNTHLGRRQETRSTTVERGSNHTHTHTIHGRPAAKPKGQLLLVYCTYPKKNTCRVSLEWSNYSHSRNRL